ncbi:hypothetical protein [Pseudooceanicola antarcticus]|uniref:hypothetical protein n=1 Tax=Pseudooceanicola antarcticus TaxID=1247613 RepID=UPI00117BA1FA|nr:hypothetical protein [Pseudooceanicola antarcticus]
MAEVYKVAVEDARFWTLPVEVHAIFGRVYAASLALSDQAKAVEVSDRLVGLIATPPNGKIVKAVWRYGQKAGSDQTRLFCIMQHLLQWDRTRHAPTFRAAVRGPPRVLQFAHANHVPMDG